MHRRLQNAECTSENSGLNIGDSLIYVPILHIRLIRFWKFESIDIFPNDENLQIANWQIATDDHQGQKTEFTTGGLKTHSFLYRAQNICTNNQL